jgi:hypothetical protein
MLRFMNSYILLMCIRNERCLSKHVTGSSGKGPKTCILTPIVFYKMPTIEFDLAAISSWSVEGEGVDAIFYPYTSTLLSVRVSQN